MKRALFLATIFVAVFTFIVSTSYAFTSPGKPQGFVNDFAGILNGNTKADLNQKLKALESSNGAQIAIVTIQTLGNETRESYATKLFDEWGMGDKNNDNGVLFLIAIAEKQLRIEVGYGLEGVLTDAETNSIIQNIILPSFKAGDYDKGVLQGTDAIISVVKKETSYAGTGNKTNKKGFNPDWFIIVFFAFIWLASALGRTKSWWMGGVFGAMGGIIVTILKGFLYTGLIALIVLIVVGLIFDFIVSKAYNKSKSKGKTPPWWIGGGGFGGGGGGFGGGGFGGFGGGSSGGGGGGGSW